MTFIIDTKYKEILETVNDKISRYLLQPDLSEVNIDNINYIGLSSKGSNQLSYYKNDKEVQNDEEKWLPKNRKLIKPGKVITALIKDNITTFSPLDIQDHSVKIKYYIKDKSKYRFEILTGADIIKAYSTENYLEKRGGTLYSSCMNNMSIDILNIYTNENASVLCLYLDDKLIGRAILWKNVLLLKNDTYIKCSVIDRFYYIFDEDFFFMKDYAKENGYYLKSNNANTFINPDTLAHETLHLSTVIKNCKPNGSYPYLDTFRYGIFENNNLTLYNTRPSNTSNYYEFDCTNGGINLNVDDDTTDTDEDDE